VLALHRSPTDANATVSIRSVSLAAAQWPEGPSLLSSARPGPGELLVLPELSGLASGLAAAEIKNRAEARGGDFEKALGAAAKAGAGYVVGSYPEREGDKVYHTVALAGPEGTVLGRYRATHLPAATAAWASAGEGPVVVDTPLGRVGLALAEELRVPELGGLYGALRTDILAAPAGRPDALKVQIDAKLFAVSNPPTGRADFFPYASAKQNQLWLVSGGRRAGEATAAGIYGPEPVVETPTLTAQAGEDAVRYRTRVPAPGTWINQQQLITGQVSLYFIPIVMKDDSDCVKEWRTKGTGPLACR
jgi:predicted amidohydrolase